MPPLLSPKTAACFSALAGLVLYWNSLDNSFAWDDHYLVVNNPGIQSMEHVTKDFFSPWAAGSSAEGGRAQNAVYWRPVTQLTYATDWIRGEGSPGTFHLTNVLLHGIASALVALLMGLLWSGWNLPPPQQGMAALVAGLLFACHPIHTEAVHLITYRTTLLSATGALGSLALFYSNRQYWALLPFALGLLSKEECIVTPALLVILDWGQQKWPLTWTQRVHRYGPIGLISLAYLAIHQSITTGATLDFFAGQASDTVLFTMAKVIWLDVKLMFWPSPLSPFYDWTIFPYAHHPFDLEVAGGVLCLMAVFFSSGRALLRGKTPGQVTILALLFFVALTPYSHIVPFFDVAGERFLYLPSAAFCMAAAITLSKGLGRVPMWGKRLIGVFTAGIIVMMSWQTWERGPHFENSRTLLEATQEDFPHSYFTAFELGRMEMKSDAFRKAEKQFQRAFDNMPLEVAALCTAEAIRRQGDIKRLRSYLDGVATDHAGRPRPEINRILNGWGSGNGPTSIRCDEGNMLETTP